MSWTTGVDGFDTRVYAGYVIRFLPGVLVGVLCCLPACKAVSGLRRPTHQVLFIGNSLTYMNDLPGLVHALDPGVAVDSVTEGGISLDDHWKRGIAVAKITAGEFTHVVLQERTYDPLLHPTRFREAAKRFAELVARRGAKPIFVEVWSHRDANDPMYVKGAAWSGGSAAAMQWRLHEAISSIAQETHARAALVGDAWRNVATLHPEIALHAPDGNHPLLAGSYLAACVVLQSITGTPPSDEAPVPEGLDQAVAGTLRRAAAAR